MIEKLEDGMYVYKGQPDELDGFEFKPGKQYYLQPIPGFHTIEKLRDETLFDKVKTFLGFPKYDTFTMMTLVLVNDLELNEMTMVPYASPTLPLSFWEKVS